MDYLQKLKLDTWYGIVLYLGCLLIAASLFFKVEFLEEKNLFGLGLGMFLIGISFYKAEKTLNTIKPPNVYTGGPALISWKEIHHDIFSFILLIIGIILSGLFGYLLIKNLI